MLCITGPGQEFLTAGCRTVEQLDGLIEMFLAADGMEKMKIAFTKPPQKDNPLGVPALRLVET